MAISCCSGDACEDEAASSFAEIPSRIFTTLEDVAPAIALGIALTAAHAAWFDDIGASSTASQRLQIIAGSMPLQFCEHAVVHVCKTFLSSGFSIGTVFAFLLLAPSTNVGLFGLIGRSYGTKGIVTSLLALSASSLMLSYAIDALVEALSLSAASAKGLGVDVGPPDLLPSWFISIAPPLVAAMLAASLLRRSLRAIVPEKQHKHKQS